MHFRIIRSLIYFIFIFVRSVLIASGPFSYQEDLTYEAWADLAKVALESKPDVVMLV